MQHDNYFRGAWYTRTNTGRLLVVYQQDMTGQFVTNIHIMHAAKVIT